MSIKRVTLAEADGHLAELMEAAERGDEVFIEAENKTQVKLVAVSVARQPRVLGIYSGKIHMSPDFNEPLPEEFLLSGRP